MKKKWKEPEILVQKFVPNEYVAACGILGDGTVLYSACIFHLSSAPFPGIQST